MAEAAVVDLRGAASAWPRCPPAVAPTPGATGPGGRRGWARSARLARVAGCAAGPRPALRPDRRGARARGMAARPLARRPCRAWRSWPRPGRWARRSGPGRGRTAGPIDRRTSRSIRTDRRTDSQGGPGMDADGRTMGLLVVGAGFLGAQRAAAATRRRGGSGWSPSPTATPALAERVAARHGVGRGARPRGGPRVGRGRRRRRRHAARRPRRGRPAGAGGGQARPLREAAGDPARRGPAPGDRWPTSSRLRLATGLNHRFYPPVRDALALVGSLGDRPGRERPGRDRPPGLARVPRRLAHRGRAVRRRDPDGQRPARLRPDPPVPRRGRRGQGVRPPGRPASPPAARPRPSACSATTTTPSPSCIRAGPCRSAT